MKLFPSARLFTLLLSVMACASVLRAQKLGDNPAYYQLTARCSVNVPAQQTTPPNVVYGGSAVAFLWDEIAQSNVSGSIGGQAAVGHATTFNGNAVTAHILPNKDYQGSVTVAPWCTGIVSFVTTTFNGSVVYINGVSATNYSFYNNSNSNVNRTFTLRIALPNNYRADPEPAYLAAGAANSMVADKPILYFGLGRMRNGNSAGVIGFRAQDFSVTNLFTPGALYFSSYSPVPADEVTPVYNSGTTTLRQILSREVLVDINPIGSPPSTSYKLDFYQVGSSPPALSGGLYPLTGTLFVSYTIAKNTSSGISVTRTEDGTIWETDLVLSGTTWTFNDWHKQGTPLNSNLTTAYSTSTAATVTANGPASGLAGYTDTALSWSKSYTSYTWGIELTQTQTGSLTSNSSYYSTGTTQGLLQWATQPDGTWAAYSYYMGDATTYASVPSGKVQRIYHPWLDTTASDTAGTIAAAATTANSAYDDYTYQYVAKGADTNGAGATASLFLPASTISYAPGGTLYKKTTWAYNTRATTLNSRYVWSQTENDFSDSANSLTTTSLYYVPLATPDLLDDQPVSTTFPNGRKDSYAYFSGSWNSATNAFSAGSGNDRLILCFHGQTSGGTSVISWTNNTISWAMDSVNMVGGYSTASETVIDTNGRIVFSGENVYTTSGTLARVAGVANTYDTHGRLTDSTDIFRSVGSTLYKTQRAYTALLLNSTTAPDGYVTSYQYDDLLRQTLQTSGVTGLSNSNIYPARVQKTFYDGANRPVAVSPLSDGSSPTVFYYDAAGRVIQKTNPSPNTGQVLSTSIAYNSLTTTTTTLPTGATTISTTYADGRPKSVTGTAQSPAYISYSVNSTGLQVNRYNASSADQSQGWSVDQSDFLGRSVAHSAPTYGWATNANNIIDTASTYNASTGLLTKTTATYRATGGAMSPDHLYFYDLDGRLNKDGLDLNGDGALTASSNDRYVTYDFIYSTDSAGWLGTATTSSFPAGTSLTLSKTISRLTGFGSVTNGSNPSVSNGLIVADATVIDVNNQATRQVESVDAPTLRHHVDVTLPGPVTTQQTGWSETINGYASESMAPSGARTKNEYDSPLGRLISVKSRWNGTTYAVADTIAYYGNTGFVSTQTVNGIVTTRTYAWGTDGTSTVTTSDAATNYSFTVNNAMGLPWHTGGTATSPVKFTYDGLGRRTAMTTWRNGNATDDSHWPTGTGDTTTWTIEAATGLTTRKTLADNSHVDFTYTSLGQPLTRVNARGITTNYTYYDGSTGTNADVSYRTQELKSITYGDGITPAVSYTYNRSGLPATINDGTTVGTSTGHTFGYDSQPLRLLNETLSSFSGSRVETQLYDSYYRPSGFKLSGASGSGIELNQAYAYDSVSGLPGTLATTPLGQTPRTFTFGWKTNTQLFTGYTTPVTGGNYALGYDYQATTNLRSQVTNSFAATVVNQSDLTYNNLGQIQTVKQSGSAFKDYYLDPADSTKNFVTNSFAYDAMRQLKSKAVYSATYPTTELPGRHFEYRYDSMGNRLTAGESGNNVAHGGPDDDYFANSLNQYSSRTNNTVRVLGTVAPDASISVAVSGASATTKFDCSWGADLVPGQGASAANGTVTVNALFGSTNKLRTDTGKKWFIPPARQVFTYDADGNLLTDGVWAYAYDAENRLISMTSQLPASAGFKRWNLSFVYDYLGRRVQKIATNLDTTTDPTPSYTRRYVYNGWNLVAELDATGATLKRSYTWGLDLTGSATATGGVGALMQITDHTQAPAKNYFPAYDQNGNVSALTGDDTTGTLAAAYEYSPFGEPLRADANDTAIADNPFRFSTKFTDIETGLVYYGQRYYSPSLGRFINQDPIAEAGGINLYGFCGNNGVNSYDMLGMDDHSMFGVAHPEWTQERYEKNVNLTLRYGHVNGSIGPEAGYSAVNDYNDPWLNGGAIWHTSTMGPALPNWRDEEDPPPPPPKDTEIKSTTRNSDGSITYHTTTGDYTVTSSDNADFNSTGLTLIGGAHVSVFAPNSLAGVRSSGPYSHSVDTSQTADLLEATEGGLVLTESGYVNERYFSVFNPSRSGYIMQHVSRTGPFKEFWELFPVNLNGTSVDYPMGNRDNISFTDHRSTVNSSQTVTLDAVWMPGYTPNPNDGWHPGGLFGGSGDLMMTTRQPTGWPSAGDNFTAYGEVRIRQTSSDGPGGTQPRIVTTVWVGANGFELNTTSLPPLVP